MKSKYLIYLFLIFSLLDISISFFGVTESILIQTLYGISKIALLLVFLHVIPNGHKGFEFLRNVLKLYWLGQLFLYIFNALIHNDYNTWVSEFNNWFYLIPIYVVSLLLSIWISYRNEWSEHRSYINNNIHNHRVYH